MTIARRDLVREGMPGVYHCTARCVRRAFLLGQDDYSGKNYDHRRQWIVDRLSHLTKVFGLEVLAYAAMSNHLHIVVRTQPEQVAGWSDEEVARRWLALYTPKHGGIDGHPVTHQASKGDFNLILQDSRRLKDLRERLGSLSWFMKSLNEHIARMANREDDCKGRFWEGRFKCQRLESEAAILACMCYVDLNPIRARMADSLEDTHFTSAYDRISRMRQKLRANISEIYGPEAPQIKETSNNLPLVDLDGPKSPFTHWGETDYLRILDATDRELRKDKPGVISSDVRPLLEALELDTREWVQTVARYQKRFGLVAGTIAQIRQAAEDLGRQWLKGCRSASVVFSSSEDPAPTA